MNDKNNNKQQENDDEWNGKLLAVDTEKNALTLHMVEVKRQ